MFFTLGGESPPVRLQTAVVAAVSNQGGVEVLLVDGQIPATHTGLDETTAQAACRLFEELTGVKARASPYEPGFVDVSPATFFDPPSARPVTAMVYVARLPAKTTPAVPAAEWRSVAKLEDQALMNLVASAVARS